MKRKGFTLVELVITIVIIIALMSISVPIYNINNTKVKIAEGYALLATIRSAQEQYFAEWGNFLHSQNGNGGTVTNWGDWKFTSNEEILHVNARTNKFFTCFSIGGKANQDGLKYYYIAGVNSKETNITMDYNLTKGVTIY
ncbi:MAG: prepilin-type N-terminal cleavage/methylation domain-containing protein [Elusimicrobia bacterium]|nr:prepilin-type N-terminal cleavage/methylation domain-containing protein [Elusimicrobiota bacterium]